MACCAAPRRSGRFFARLFEEFAKPGMSFEMLQQEVDGDTAYIVWKAETAENRFEWVPTPSLCGTARSSPRRSRGRSRRNRVVSNVQDKETFKCQSSKFMSSTVDTTSAALANVSKAVQDLPESILKIPSDDFFQVIHELPRNCFRTRRRLSGGHTPTTSFCLKSRSSPAGRKKPASPCSRNCLRGSSLCRNFAR